MTDYEMDILDWITLPSVVKMQAQLDAAKTTSFSRFVHRSSCRIHTLSILPVDHASKPLRLLCPLLEYVQHLEMGTQRVWNVDLDYRVFAILGNPQAFPLLRFVSLSMVPIVSKIAGAKCHVVTSLTNAIRYRRVAGVLERVTFLIVDIGEDAVDFRKARPDDHGRFLEAVRDLQTWNAACKPAVDLRVGTVRGTIPSLNFLSARVAYRFLGEQIQLVALNPKHGIMGDCCIQWNVSQ